MNTGSMSASPHRTCPLCQGTGTRDVLSMTGEQICAGNWTYSTLRLPPSEYLQRRYPLLHCEACGFTYAAQVPPPEFLDFVYDSLIDATAARTAAYEPGGMAGRMEYVAHFVRLVGSGRKVLDFGCGFGPTLALLNAIEGMQVYGFETSRLRAAQLRDRFPNIFDNPQCLADAGPFAGLILDNVLEHVADPIGCLRLLTQLCEPDAILYVSVPDMSASRLSTEIRRHRRGQLPSMEINPWEHLGYFDLASLDRACQSVGFVPLKQMELPGEVRVGLRPEKYFAPRLKNALATALRCAKYAVTGVALQSPNARFYRFNTAPSSL